MRSLRKALLAGAGALILGGAAAAASQKSHVLDVLLPSGEIARIHYEGDVAPRVVVAPAAAAALPVAMADPFADLDRISAAMDRQAQAMMRQVAEMQARAAADPQAMHRVTMGGEGSKGAPAGVVQYSYVSTTTSNNGCTTSVQWSSDGSGAEPRMVKTSAGDCKNGKDNGGGAPARASKAAASKPAASKAPASKVDEAIPGANRT